MGTIQVLGARIHNLQKINVTLPKGKFIVFTGVSGSGKSSLAFDILYEEGRKRYLQSIGLSARGEVIDEHEPFDELVGLPPAIAVEQHKIRQSNPRSIVGTKTKALHDLKWLYALEGRGTDGERTSLTPNHFAFYASLAECCATCEGRGYFAKPDIEKIIDDPNRKVSKRAARLYRRALLRPICHHDRKRGRECVPTMISTRMNVIASSNDSDWPSSRKRSAISIRMQNAGS